MTLRIFTAAALAFTLIAAGCSSPKQPSEAEVRESVKYDTQTTMRSYGHYEVGEDCFFASDWWVVERKDSKLLPFAYQIRRSSAPATRQIMAKVEK